MSLSLIVPPAEEPITVADLRAHLRLDDDADEGALPGFIAAARRAVEARGGLALIAQVWRLEFDRAPARELVLPRSPVSAILSVETIGADGGAQAIAPELYETVAGPVGRVLARAPWPRLGRELAAYRIEFAAGWANAAAAPEELKLAVRMLAGHFFENREGAAAERIFAVPQAVDALIGPHRRVRL